MAQRKSTGKTTAAGKGRAAKKKNDTTTSAQARKRTASTATKTTQKKATQQIEIAPAHDVVATRAYEIWLERGRPLGCDHDIWFEAETQLARN